MQLVLSVPVISKCAFGINVYESYVQEYLKISSHLSFTFEQISKHTRKGLQLQCIFAAVILRPEIFYY